MRTSEVLVGIKQNIFLHPTLQRTDHLQLRMGWNLMKIVLSEKRGGEFQIVATGEAVAVPRIGETVGVFGKLIEGSITIREFSRYKVIDICHYLYDEESLGSDKSEIPPQEISLFVVATE